MKEISQADAVVASALSYVLRTFEIEMVWSRMGLDL